MAKEAVNMNERARDSASQETLLKAERDCVETCFNRMDTQSNQCKFGTTGVCCRICHMGPCRITPKSPKGVCGADADTIVARNFLREVVGGTAAHSDHGRHLVLLLKKVALGKGGDFSIKDKPALLNAAKLFLKEFMEQEEPLKTLLLAPKKQQGIWKNQSVEPSGIDRMVVEAMHRS